MNVQRRIQSVRVRLRSAIGRRRFEKDLDASWPHLAMQERAGLGRGSMSDAEARRYAQRALGGVHLYAMSRTFAARLFGV